MADKDTLPAKNPDTKLKNEDKHQRLLGKKAPQPMEKRGVVVLTTLLLAVLAVMFGVRMCTRPHPGAFGKEYPAKSGGDTLDIAIEVSPLRYNVSAGDSISGLDYELLKEMGKALGRPVKFHPFSPIAYAYKGLQKGVFDMMVTTLPTTDSLKNYLSLTRPVYVDRAVLVQNPKDTSAVKRPIDLANKEIWIGDGSPLKQRITHLQSEIGENITVHSQPGLTAEHVLLLVGEGEIPRAAVNSGLASRMAAKDSTLQINTDIGFNQFQSWAVGPDKKELTKQIDSWLEGFQKSPQYANILKRYGLSAAQQ